MPSKWEKLMRKVLLCPSDQISISYFIQIHSACTMFFFPWTLFRLLVSWLHESFLYRIKNNVEQRTFDGGPLFQHLDLLYKWSWSLNCWESKLAFGGHVHQFTLKCYSHSWIKSHALIRIVLKFLYVMPVYWLTFCWIAPYSFACQ